MNGKVKLTFSLWICAVLLLLWGCREWDYAHERSKRLWPSEQGFPDREIVFAIPHAINHDTIGFIHTDGSGLITRTVAPGIFVNFPTWSPDGQYIAVRADSLAGFDYFYGMYPRVVSAEGETVGWCPNWEKGQGRVWVTPGGQLVFSHFNGHDPSQLILANPESCETAAVLYEASVGDDYVEDVDSGMLSSAGALVLSRGMRQPRTLIDAEIIVIDPGTESEHVVGQGLAPAWSQDGEWLTYTGVDGIYIVRKDGTDRRLVVAMTVTRNQQEFGLWSDITPTAAWSPDGEWLVYSRLTPHSAVISKVNVETGEEVELFDGGMYPNWRWDLDGTNE